MLFPREESDTVRAVYAIRSGGAAGATAPPPRENLTYKFIILL
jgi:hypothetical protein